MRLLSRPRHKFKVDGSPSYKWDGTALGGEDFGRSYTATLAGLAGHSVVEFTIQQHSGGDKDMFYGQSNTRASIRYPGTWTG